MIELRYQEGELDEVVAEDVSVHLEQQDDNQWWMGITDAAGGTVHVWLTTPRAQIKGFVIDEAEGTIVKGEVGKNYCGPNRKEVEP